MQNNTTNRIGAYIISKRHIVLYLVCAKGTYISFYRGSLFMCKTETCFTHKSYPCFYLVPFSFPCSPFLRHRSHVGPAVPHRQVLLSRQWFGKKQSTQRITGN